MIRLYNTLDEATEAFNASKHSDLLYAERYNSWVVDETKKAKSDWPKLYQLLKTK